jgi:glyoxylase-like metal-dependent hydrolase (beta-lactamase superfamily II)
VFLKQYCSERCTYASYLLADDCTRTATVVDPGRNVHQYMRDAADHGWHIRHIVLTHIHPNFPTGHIALQHRTGATIYLGARGHVPYPVRSCKDGDVFDGASMRLRILETPGHTPESISILVYDLTRAPDRPRAVLTGGTLLIGDVGRPDVPRSQATALAESLYDSLHRKLLTLPDDTLVYPARGPGAAHSQTLWPEAVSTIGVQRRFNHALRSMSKERFVQLVTAT